MHSVIHNLKKREGFTLIELMIVVAIIGILAAIAIPNFIKFQLRSKASEGKINLAAIRTAEESYFAEVGTYIAWAPTPIAGVPGQVKVPFDPIPCPNPPVPASPGYCIIGWSPEGDVYYQYDVLVGNAAGGLQMNQFFAGGRADIDGDVAFNDWGLSRPDPLAVPLGGSTFCPAVMDQADPTGTTFVQNQVGPCNNVTNGRQVF